MVGPKVFVRAWGHGENQTAAGGMLRKHQVSYERKKKKRAGKQKDLYQTRRGTKLQ